MKYFFITVLKLTGYVHPPKPVAKSTNTHCTVLCNISSDTKKVIITL